jgi:hypothetical protein
MTSRGSGTPPCCIAGWSRWPCAMPRHSGNHTQSPSRAMRPGFCLNFALPATRARGIQDVRCTRSLVCAIDAAIRRPDNGSAKPMALGLWRLASIQSDAGFAPLLPLLIAALFAKHVRHLVCRLSENIVYWLPLDDPQDMVAGHSLFASGLLARFVVMLFILCGQTGRMEWRN